MPHVLESGANNRKSEINLDILVIELDCLRLGYHWFRYILWTLNDRCYFSTSLGLMEFYMCRRGGIHTATSCDLFCQYMFGDHGNGLVVDLNRKGVDFWGSCQSGHESACLKFKRHVWIKGIYYQNVVFRSSNTPVDVTHDVFCVYPLVDDIITLVSE